MIKGFLRIFTAGLLILVLLISTATLALAEGDGADAGEERVLYFSPLVSVEPGLTVVPGTQLTLTLLPESFPYNPDLSLDEAGITITWCMDVDDELIELGEGMTCTTIPMEPRFNHGIIYPLVDWNMETDIFDHLYEVHTYLLEVTVGEPGEANPDARIMQTAQDGKQNLSLVNVNGVCDTTVWMEADGMTIAGMAPDEDDETFTEGTSFEWLETDAQGNPLTGVLGSAWWFTPPTALEGTRYYLCRGYCNQQPVAGEARFIVRTADVPAYVTALSPAEVFLGGTVNAVTTYQGETVNAQGQVTRSQLEAWVEEQTGEKTESLEDVSGEWYIMSWSEVETPASNPAQIDNITDDFAEAEFSYSLTASYSTAGYFGTLTWDTEPVMLTVLDENGDPVMPGSPGDMYLTIDDLFTENAHLAQEALAEALEEALEMPVTITLFRNGEPLAPDSWCATNDDVVICDAEGNQLGDIVLVIRGDVLGTGTMDIAQVVRVAQALTGQSPLEGPYLEAGCFNDTEEIDIVDLVGMATLLRDAVRG